MAREISWRTGRPVTKAERIFADTYYECLRHVEAWGIEYNKDGQPVPFNGLITNDNVCKRTCNEVTKFVEYETTRLNLLEKYGKKTADENKVRRDALRMLVSTINYQLKTLK